MLVPSLIALVLSALLFFNPTVSLSSDTVVPERPARAHSEGASKSAVTNGPQCQTAKVKEQITITCDYTGAQLSSAQAMPPIELNHASLSFEIRDDNYMSVELIFTNRSDEVCAG